MTELEAIDGGASAPCEECRPRHEDPDLGGLAAMICTCSCHAAPPLTEASFMKGIRDFERHVGLGDRRHLEDAGGGS
jgi:hypothetical protein